MLFPKFVNNGDAMHFRQFIQGKVFLSVLVGIEGRAIEVKIANSSGYSILDNSALSAVRKWQFVPAKKNGEAVSATVIVPVEFKIV